MAEADSCEEVAVAGKEFFRFLLEEFLDRFPDIFDLFEGLVCAIKSSSRDLCLVDLVFSDDCLVILGLCKVDSIFGIKSAVVIPLLGIEHDAN